MLQVLLAYLVAALAASGAVLALGIVRAMRHSDRPRPRTRAGHARNRAHVYHRSAA